MHEVIVQYSGDGEDFYNLKRITELVRCKNCVYCETGKTWSPYCTHPDGMDDIKENYFCSNGILRN